MERADEGCLGFLRDDEANKGNKDAYPNTEWPE